MKNLRLLALLITLSFTFNACKKLVKDVDIPTYLKVNEFTFTTEYDNEGSDSEKISDVWVYIDDQLQGIYELPAEFPVIASEGTHTVKLRPGIKMNGIAATRVVYPFYQHYEEEVQFSADGRVTISPTTSYTSSTHFAWMEDFETGETSWVDDEATDTSMYRTASTSWVYEGLGCGKIPIHEEIDFFEIQSEELFELPKDGSAIFLEMNYLIDNLEGVSSDNMPRLAVGLIGFESTTIVQGSPIIWINPSAEWNKIYINLTPTVTSQTAAGAFRVYFGVVRQEGQGTANMYLDNIKLVHVE